MVLNSKSLVVNHAKAVSNAKMVTTVVYNRDASRSIVSLVETTCTEALT